MLTHFNETEIAAWFLFASLNFMGMIVSQRLALTFSRMLAFAMGGASTLGPIQVQAGDASRQTPNWHVFERSYRTIGALNFGMGWFNVLIAFCMGWFALNNLLQDYDEAAVVWLAFLVIQASELCSFVFQRYEIALRGMNYVAMVNRWSAIVGLLSCLAGAVALLSGGGLIVLAIVMQAFSLCGIVCNRLLLRAVEEGRVANYKGIGFDREVFLWAWEPTWKGFVAHFSVLGTAQLTGVLLTSILTPLQLASYLLSMKLLQTVDQLATSIFSSVTPMLSKMLAAGRIDELKKVIKHRVTAALVLLAAGYAVLLCFGDYALDLIGSEVSLLPSMALTALSLPMLFYRFGNLIGGIAGVGNKILFWREEFFAGVVTLLTLLLFLDRMELIYVCAMIYFPKVLLINMRPVWVMKSYTRQSVREIMHPTFWPVVLYFILCLFINFSL